MKNYKDQWVFNSAACKDAYTLYTSTSDYTLLKNFGACIPININNWTATNIKSNRYTGSYTLPSSGNTDFGNYYDALS